MASLSRIHRPQKFAEITGQESIKETLRLEVESGKIGHAYFFAGPRGVGKTTTARIFAKALNCLDLQKGEPCNSCDACREVMDGRAVDVIEMDAASNTGVDNVREAIVEHVRFAPTSRKHKVYILDEAHMLSTSAWNALLKTIEEPPAYAVFILITTEVHKVPATILSRCQRFDFKRLQDDELVQRLNTLAEQEKLHIDPIVIKTIVRKSDGCVRDAESFLGQLMSLGEHTITAEIASLVLSVSRLPLAAQMLSSWSKRELGLALEAVQNLEDQGIPILPLMDDLIDAIRQLLLASDSVTWRQRLAEGDEGERGLAALVTAYEPAELSDMALMLMERRRDAKQGADSRFCLELAAAAVALSMLPHGPTKPDTQLRHIDPNPIAQPVQSLQKPSFVSPPSRGGAGGGAVLAVATPVPVAPSTVVEVPVSEETSLRLVDVQAKWSAILRQVDEKSPSLTFVLKITKPIEVRGKTIVLQFQYPFHKEKILEDVKSRRIVEDCLAQVFNITGLRIDGIIGVEEESKKASRSQDMVSNILKAFEGQFVDETKEATGDV